jgi:hypothetical protein
MARTDFTLTIFGLGQSVKKHQVFEKHEKVSKTVKNDDSKYRVQNIPSDLMAKTKKVTKFRVSQI